MPPPPPTEGAQARARLLHAALRLFAENGFAKASIRDIAQAAGVNPASISYYFGDKNGLYRAAFTEPMGSPIAVDAWPDTLPAFIELLIQSFMQPLHEGDLVELCMRLHFREMLDPTGLWQQELDSEIKPLHSTLIRLLCQAVGAPAPDDDIHRLALAISALPLQYYAHRDLIQQMAPQLLNDPECLQATTRRLSYFAHPMIAGET